MLPQCAQEETVDETITKTMLAKSLNINNKIGNETNKRACMANGISEMVRKMVEFAQNPQVTVQHTHTFMACISHVNWNVFAIYPIDWSYIFVVCPQKNYLYMWMCMSVCIHVDDTHVSSCTTWVSLFLFGTFILHICRGCDTNYLYRWFILM